MKNKKFSQYMNKCMEDYKKFMGISFLPKFKLAAKHVSLTNAGASGWGALATHRFDFQTQVHYIEVWEDIWKPQLHGDYVIFHELTHLIDTENIVKGNRERNVKMRGYLEYHASQIETIKILGNKNINDNSPFSMNRKLQTVSSVKFMHDFVNEPANTANSLLARKDFPKDIDTLVTTIGLIFNYYGRRSICLMYAEDFQESIGKDKFSELIGAEQFAALDVFLKGWLNEMQIEVLGQFYFQMIATKMKEYGLM